MVHCVLVLVFPGSLHFTLVGGQSMAKHVPMIHEPMEEDGVGIPDLSLKIPQIKIEKLKSEYASIDVRVEQTLQDEAERPRYSSKRYDDVSQGPLYSLQSDGMDRSFTYFDEDEDLHGLSWISAKKKKKTPSRWKECLSHQEHEQEVHSDENGLGYCLDDGADIYGDRGDSDGGDLGVDDDFDMLETSVMQHYDLCHVAPQPRLSPRSRMKEWEMEKDAMKAETPESGEEWANESDTDVEESKHEAYLSREYGLGDDLQSGANIAGFLKVADAMIAEGSC
jgi:hypothetical protein